MHTLQKKHFQAGLLVALSGILYGFLGYLGTTIIRENFSISTMLFWRFFIAGCWMLLFVLKKHSTHRVLDYIDRRSLLSMFLLGAIGYAGSSGFYFVASQYTGTGLAMVIFFTYPIMVALASWMLHRKKLTLPLLLTLCAMMIGLYLLRNTASDEYSLIGISWGVISALCYAFYLIGSKYIASVTMDSNVLTMMVSFGCAAIFLILALSSHSFVFPHSTKSWCYILAVGIFATALPIQLMLEGLKYVSSMRASIISVLEPLVTVVVGMLLLNESITYLQTIGAFIVLTSAMLIQFQKEL
jgi:drug/metabolite transporter (DMT)-like permease